VPVQHELSVVHAKDPASFLPQHFCFMFNTRRSGMVFSSLK
jgi:hypothetical protein